MRGYLRAGSLAVAAKQDEAHRFWESEPQMLIEELTTKECHLLLKEMKFGRLACASNNQPYVVPVYFIPYGDYLYGFSAMGQKIDWMRKNPRVCVEVDEITDHLHWKTVVIDGTYEELDNTPAHAADREYALELLQHRPMWWQPASVAQKHPGKAAFTPIFFRIRINHMTGHQAKPDFLEEDAIHPDAVRSQEVGLSRVRNVLN